MKYFRKIICIMISVATLISILSIGSIVVNADVGIDMLSYENAYDYCVELNTKSGPYAIKMEDKPFSNVKTDEKSEDHIIGKDLYFYPTISSNSSVKVSGSIGDVMYYSLGAQYIGGGEQQQMYAILCYSDGSPIFLNPKDYSKTISGENLNNVNIYIYASKGIDFEKILDSEEYVGLSASEKWGSADVYDLVSSGYISPGKNLDNVNRDGMITVYNKSKNHKRSNGPFKWSDFAGDKNGHYKIAFYSGSGVNAFFYAGGKQASVELYLCTSKNKVLKKEPTYKSGVSLNTSTGLALTELRVAGVYAGVDKNNLTDQKTDAWGLSSTLNASDSFRESITAKNINKGSLKDIKIDAKNNELLKSIYKIKISGSKFNKVGYWYLALDYVLGYTIDTGNTESYVYASYEVGHTRRAVIGVNEAGNETLTAGFTNQSYLSPENYDPESDDKISVRLKFTGSSEYYECKVRIFDAKDINKSGIGEDNLAAENKVLKEGYTELFSASTDKIKINTDKHPECSDNKFKVDSLGNYFIDMPEGIEDGTYYIEVAARPKGDKTYRIKWLKMGIGKKDGYGKVVVGENGNEAEEESLVSKIEANRELTFAEERKIDELNKEINNKEELDRWAWVYIIMAVCGIIILVYSILLIVVYYVDLFNSLTEVSIYHKLTFGNMYPVGSAENIEHLRIDEESKVKYATHKTAWTSFVIGVLASAILLNGKTVVLAFISLINWFSNLISNIGS